MISNDGSMFVGLLSLGCLKYAAMHLTSRRVKVGKVASIQIYPIKACHGINLQSALCTYEGWKHPTQEIWDRCVTCSLIFMNLIDEII